VLTAAAATGVTSGAVCSVDNETCQAALLCAMHPLTPAEQCALVMRSLTRIPIFRVYGFARGACFYMTFICFVFQPATLRNNYVSDVLMKILSELYIWTRK